MRRTELPLWILASTFTHGLLVALVSLFIWFHHHARSHAGGEDGHGGAGDTIDISLAASPTPAPAPTTEVEAPPITAAIGPAIHTETKRPVRQAPPTSGNAAETHTGRLAGPGGDTVEGQRALLPGAVTCKDPIEGRWEALKYNPFRHNWVRFSLSVHRGAGGTVNGSIVSRSWSGNALDSSPPQCSLDGYDMTVAMNAHGTSDPSGRITFGSSSYSIVDIHCPSLDLSYAPDSFSGTVDGARQEFQSVNNDGATDVNAPYVFRRTGCN